MREDNRWSFENCGGNRFEFVRDTVGDLGIISWKRRFRFFGVLSFLDSLEDSRWDIVVALVSGATAIGIGYGVGGEVTLEERDRGLEDRGIDSGRYWQKSL